MVMRLFCCLLLLTASPLWAASQLQASVDKNPVQAGEFFILTISLDDSINNEQPDTAALMKDFVVGPMSMSSRTNIINGAINKQTNWSVKLMTRKEGNYTIPAFYVAGLSSQPINLVVTKRAVADDKNNDIYIETALSKDSLYVQEAGVYTVKLFLAKELLDGSLTAPTMPDAQLTQLGKQTEDYQLVNGKRYLVISREYLIQPQKSGVYTITAPSFEGRIRESYRQLSVSALADDATIEIKPIPENYQGDWLPSELVSLDEQWQPEDNTVEVGTPITRTITLTALGVTKEQLPEIPISSIDGIRSYPDDKENNNAVRNGRVVSQQVASYALLPQQPGTYTLPAVSLPWFNTKTNRIQYATLPERTLTVKPSSNPLLPTQPAGVANTPPDTQNKTSGNMAQPPVIKEQYPLWLIIVAVLGYILWLATVIFLLLTRSTQQQASLSPQSAPSNASLAQLTKLAKANDYSAFYRALLHYAAAQSQSADKGLDGLRQQLNSREFNQLIAQLQRKLYAHNAESVDLSLIVKLLSNHKAQMTKQDKEPLKPLY